MRSKSSYIGAHVDSELKGKFVHEAEKQGLTQTDLLNSIFNNYFGSGVNYSPLNREESEAFINNDREEWDKIGTLVRTKLNCLIIQIHQEIYTDGHLHLPRFLEMLGDLLIQKSDNDIDYNCEEEEDYSDIIAEDVANEVTTIIARAVREFGGTTPSQEDLFTLAGKFFLQRADRHYVDARRLGIKFNREEWYYLDKLLVEVNQDMENDFSSLNEFIRYKLGEQMEYAGRGFLAPRDRGMLEMGQRFMKEHEG